jgi:hypothetical protein
VIVLGLYLMFDRVQRAFRSGTTQVDVLEGGRSTANIVVRDLAQIQGVGVDPTDVAAGTTNFNPLKAYINVFLEDNTPPNPVWQQLVDGSAVSNKYKELLFLHATNGAWTAIGYRLATRTNCVLPPTNGVGTLLRFEYGIPSPNALRIPKNTAQETNNPIYRFTNPAYSNDFQPVLDGVVHFDVRLEEMVVDSSGVPVNGPVVATNTSQIPNTTPFFQPLSANAVVMNDRRTPIAVEFELGVLEPQAANQVRGLPTVRLQTNFLFAPEQAGRVHLFRQRVPIRQGF